MGDLGSIVIEYMNKTGKKLTKEELRKQLNISGEEEVNFFNYQLEQLECSDALFLDDKGFYHLPEDVTCAKISISRKGIGYVIIEDENEKKKYIIKNQSLNGALPNDYVLIEKTGIKYHGKNTAYVSSIVKRNEENQIYKYIGNGIFQLYGVKSNVNFKIDENKCDGLVVGTLVFGHVEPKIIAKEKDKLFFEGTIEKIIGHCDDPDCQVKIVGLKYGFDNEFSDKINKIVSKLPTQVTSEDKIGRKDLTEELTFTIDCQDTKDIDDAISIKKTDQGYILKVSIADVSHYVKSHPQLVEEAITRGNSAYLADSVFPMFPHTLSNGICSLNPNQERLAKTVEIIFDNEGEVISSSVYKSVIKSKKKMNYDDVNKIFDGKKIEGYEPFEESLMHMRKLSKILSKKRKDKGSLYFDSRELKIKTDYDGKPIEIDKVNRKEAEILIENFMIAANIEVTQHFGYLDYPFIFRVHSQPDNIKLKAVLEVLKSQDLGNAVAIDNTLTLIEKGKQIRPQNLFPILNTIKNDDCFEAVSEMLLKAMEKAEYSPVNTGHFGLSESDYSHFTSPIRRCADLINHIIIDYSMELNNAKTNEEMKPILDKIDAFNKRISTICQHISKKEKDADEAEAEVDELKQIQYVKNHLEDFEGPIAANINYINRSGLKIIVDDLIEARISSTDLIDNGYIYKHDTHTFIKANSKLKLGDTIYVLDPEIMPDIRLIVYHGFGLEKSMITNKNKARVLRKSLKSN